MPGILIVTILLVHGVCPLKVLLPSSPHFSIRKSNTRLFSPSRECNLPDPSWYGVFLFHSNMLPVSQINSSIVGTSSVVQILLYINDPLLVGHIKETACLIWGVIQSQVRKKIGKPWTQIKSQALFPRWLSYLKKMLWPIKENRLAATRPFL